MVTTDPRIRRWLKRLATVAAVLVVVWLTASLFVSYKLTRRPHALVAEPPPSVTWAVIEPVRLHTSDGLELGAWYMPGRPGGPSAVLLHGYRSRRSESIPIAEILVNEGYSVLAVSMRAHGDSEGDYTDVGYSSRRDVEAAVAWLEQRRPGKPILVQGTSMGAAAAIYAAEDLQTRVSRLHPRMSVRRYPIRPSAIASPCTFPGRWTSRLMPVCGFSRRFFCRTSTA